ncbi:MAG: YceD family protein [bacterium]
MKFNIDLERILQEGSVNISGEKSCQPNEFKISKPISYNLLITKIDDDISISGKISVDMPSNCSRCLDFFENRIDVPVNIVQKFNWAKEKEVDISDELHSGIVLAMPINPLCKSDCGGLCSLCGNNRNRVKCNCRTDFNQIHAFEKLKSIKIK